MATAPPPQARRSEPIDGAIVLNNKRRLTLPKEVCEALRIAPGATLTYRASGGALLLIPEDKELHEPSDTAAENGAAFDPFEETDPAVQAILDELPAIRAEVNIELYGAEFGGGTRPHARGTQRPELAEGEPGTGDAG